MTEHRNGNWMQTYQGKQFWPVDPRPEEIEIEDIAHSLSMLCRYNGHCEHFYSVAEHSVLVSNVVPAEDAFVALLHDATEAFVSDVPRPLKPFLPGYDKIEHRVWEAICERFNLPIELPESVKRADNEVLMAEMHQIMKGPPKPWNVDADPAPVVIGCYRPQYAKKMFLDRFNSLLPSYA